MEKNIKSIEIVKIEYGNEGTCLDESSLQQILDLASEFPYVANTCADFHFTLVKSQEDKDAIESSTMQLEEGETLEEAIEYYCEEEDLTIEELMETNPIIVKVDVVKTVDIE